MASAPLWQQVLEDLERRIAEGEIGERFPTDRELVETYGVSRHTVREAVRRLRVRGVLERHRGRGSFLTSPEFRQPVGTLYSLFREVEAAGIEQTSDVLAFAIEQDADAAARLGLEAEAPLVRLERRRLADGEPLALDTTWLPRDVGEPLMEADFTHTALYDELDKRCDLRLTGGEEVIRPIVPDSGLCRTLELDSDEGVFRVERLGRVGDRVVEWRVTYIRGTRFALVSTWDPSRPHDPGGMQVTARSTS